MDTLGVLLLCVLPLNILSLGDVQSYEAYGKIYCDGKPAPMLRVRLYDRDKFSEDELMGEADTSADGSFRVGGHSTELTAIEPYLKIYHHCGDQGEFLFVHCPLNSVEELPSEKITVGEVRPIFAHDTGVIRLRGGFRREDEERRCVD